MLWPSIMLPRELARMCSTEFIASPESVLGQVQRGRGEGYRRILRLPRDEAHAILLNCIAQDPRRDRQIESRGEFYAAIAIEIDLPLEALVVHVRRDDDQDRATVVAELAVTTLAELAKRNYKNARVLLCDDIRRGPWWPWPIEDLLELADDGFSQCIVNAIEQHFLGGDALDEAVTPASKGLWAKLAPYSPRIQASLEKNANSGAPEAISETFPAAPREMLALANQDNFRKLGKLITEAVSEADIEMLVSHVLLDKPFTAYVALAGLRRLAPVSHLEWLCGFHTSIARMSNSPRMFLNAAVVRIILAMPANLTLPLAREWILELDGPKRDLAECILEKHATVDDIPWLRSFLRSTLLSDETEFHCSLINAFNHLPNAGMIPELVDIFRQYRFSWGRVFATEAIQVTSPAFFQNNLAQECLWDCEEEIRELGAKFAPLESEEARQRIQRMAQDPFEKDKVRIQAQERLREQCEGRLRFVPAA